jgi:hypothetical protein
MLMCYQQGYHTNMLIVISENVSIDMHDISMPCHSGLLLVVGKRLWWGTNTKSFDMLMEEVRFVFASLSFSLSPSLSLSVIECILLSDTQTSTRARDIHLCLDVQAQGYMSFCSIIATLQLLDLVGANQWILSDSDAEPLCHFILQQDSELLTVAWTAVSVLGWAHAWETVLARTTGATDQVRHVVLVCLRLCAASIFVFV